ncbi:MAG: hypothetical protein NVS1B13_03490 [Flavisolibacter sp.]
MHLSRYSFFGMIFTVLSFFNPAANAQMGFQLDIPKPAPYENRVLKAEKSSEKKLSRSKRFLQDLTTHFNYFFNASNKLNEVIDRAKAVHRDDFTQLLSFYDYSLSITAQDKSQLDSVIYKSQTGIVLHDLRTDWIDNLYLLWGAAYYLEKKFDSATLMFQFINYSFAEKEKDGYYRYIGSRLDGNEPLSIATQETTRFPKNLSAPPSRNDAFIWRIRSLIEEGNFGESGTLITTLSNDPKFPKRLSKDLEEVQALWFYKQNLWDSAAQHLILCLDNARSPLQRGRWEYLTAQMYERCSKLSEAQQWYQKCIIHTTDPVMEVYARLNAVRVNKSGGDNYIDKNISELLRMAKKDRYLDYRDIIFYMAAEMELSRNNFASANQYLLKSAKYNQGNFSSRSHAYLLIADLSYEQKNYLQAAAFYDSIQLQGMDPALIQKIETRKSNLLGVVAALGVINRQDSLQKIAAMPEQERTTYINRLVRQLRRQRGIKEDQGAITSGNSVGTAAATTLFNDDAKGEWYFYNAGLKTKGALQFKQIWGSRPNVDNWRRFSDVNQQLLSTLSNNTRPGDNLATLQADQTPSFSALLSHLPLSQAELEVSNDSLNKAMFRLGLNYVNNLEDYPSAIETFEKLRTHFPLDKRMDEILFNLYFSYTKMELPDKAQEIKTLLFEKFKSSRYTQILTTRKDSSKSAKSSSEETKDYENIYDLFLAGKYTQAQAAKKNADSIYKTSSWQPQLLYIEAVYQIRQRKDSLAKNVLQTLIAQSPSSPIGKKAQNLLQVLSRRKQIEDELSRLSLEPAPKDSVLPKKQGPIVQRIPHPPIDKEPDLPYRQRGRDSIGLQRKMVTVLPPLKGSPDTSSRRRLIKPGTQSVFQFDPAAPTYATIILDKVDVVFISEARNAFIRYNQEKYYNQNFTISTVSLSEDKKLLLVGNFLNAQAALDWVQQAKKLAANESVPWLKPERFSFSLLTDWNLEIIKTKNNLDQYLKFLQQKLPGKF